MFDNYTYYINGNKVIAVSTYAGKTVRGTAKCDPKDEFDLAKGKELAAARCNANVARRRKKRALKKLNESHCQLVLAREKYDDMMDYYIDSIKAEEIANQEVKDLLSKL